MSWLNLISREEYTIGDLAMTLIIPNQSAYLVEVLEVKRRHYDSRLTEMDFDKKNGLYRVKTELLDHSQILNLRSTFPIGSTYGTVPKKKMIRLRPDKVDFSSIGEWQEFRIFEEHLRERKRLENLLKIR